ncbi:glutathione S-transferase (plasmid) [Cupriavidus necator N-1]|uniref:Glutathione S-transferase n=1 Tax=Cupriavidus necator (strain ATCC 43291 / DSM 13513 / CCUG 52238 / LMG 8453 / N-1) TaxID=1042878 RepID=F8GYU9_CUPNN|nr:glutathione S-transferase family protein [Cupriavidus necator]AEI83040.1 glutathione S-transferase [Cupriavidus necator N-1]MDX6008454.1 glutathione S-transferase family protein [Cupriavidus necator]
MLTIWGHQGSPNVQKVIWACEELGARYVRKDIGGAFGGTDTPSYLAKNPNGRVPTIEDDGFALWESHAILRYLAARDPAKRLTSDDWQARAKIDQWMDWHCAHLSPAIRSLVVLVVKPRSTMPTPEEIEAARAEIIPLLRLVDRELEQRDYVAGNTFTIADIPVAISYNLWKIMEPACADFPALEAWYARINRRVAFKPMSGQRRV